MYTYASLFDHLSQEVQRKCQHFSKEQRAIMTMNRFICAVSMANIVDLKIELLPY